MCNCIHELLNVFEGSAQREHTIVTIIIICVSFKHQSAKSQYSSEWQSKTLGTLTFAPSSSQVDITIDVDQFQQHQTCIELLSENKVHFITNIGYY